jgi:hypothetical protein
MLRKPTARPWQLRLAPDEDDATAKLAGTRVVSKNDVVRSALRLLLRVEEERARGSRLLIERATGDGQREVVEVWIL